MSYNNSGLVAPFSGVPASAAFWYAPSDLSATDMLAGFTGGSAGDDNQVLRTGSDIVDAHGRVLAANAFREVGAYYHLVISFPSATNAGFIVWLDGVLVGEGAELTTQPPYAGNLIIGGGGAVDEATFFPVALVKDTSSGRDDGHAFYEAAFAVEVTASPVNLFARGRVGLTNVAILGAAGRLELPRFITLAGVGRISVPSATPPVPASVVAAPQYIPPDQIGRVELWLEMGAHLQLAPSGDVLLAYDTLDTSDATRQRLTRLVQNNPLLVDQANNPVTYPDDIYHFDWGSGARAMIGELQGVTAPAAFYATIQAQITKAIASDPGIVTSPAPTVTVRRVGVDQVAVTIVVFTAIGTKLALPEFMLSGTLGAF